MPTSYFTPTLSPQLYKIMMLIFYLLDDNRDGNDTVVSCYLGKVKHKFQKPPWDSIICMYVVCV